jgi:hypothetical protein
MSARMRLMWFEVNEGGSSSSRPLPPPDTHTNLNTITAAIMTGSNIRGPLSSLPTETYQHILSFCDPSTLGRASLVSLAFLELAGPFLYRDVNVTGFDQLERLFYSEVS